MSSGWKDNRNNQELHETLVDGHPRNSAFLNSVYTVSRRNVEHKNFRSPWPAVTLLAVAVVWASNALYRAFMFITGSFVIDSLILSAVIAAVALVFWFRRRADRNMAEEIMRECEAARGETAGRL